MFILSLFLLVSIINGKSSDKKSLRDIVYYNSLENQEPQDIFHHSNEL